jgi:integrase
LFITKVGGSWLKDQGRANPLSAECRKLLLRVGIHRPGCSFYTWRHITETIGGEAKDPPALNTIMGHVDDSMAGIYRERISDERLQDVAAVIRRWLFRRTSHKIWGSRNALVSSSARAKARKRYQ